MTRFKRTLKKARLCVRELTHTLHLPPAQSELYDGPHAEWLRDVLEQLPNLQSLLVSQLQFFDHQSLQALRHHIDSGQQNASDASPKFALRRLVASKCRNTTSAGLSEGLLHLPSLVFLDLSNTTGVRDQAVLSKFKYMPNLQILKIRQANLRDEDIEILAAAIGIRVRSLDLRGNLLTDIAARTLVKVCFKKVEAGDGPVDRVLRDSNNISPDDWPSGIARPNPNLLDDFRNDALEEHFTRQLSDPAVTRLPSEDLAFSGITHLYIADNFLTVEGLSSLVKSECLFVLDAGMVRRASNFEKSPGYSSSSLATFKPPLDFGRIERLVPLLHTHSFRKMTSLRIHHAVVTEATLSKVDDPHPISYELNSRDSRHELDGVEQVFELASVEAKSRCELPGDPLHHIPSPAIGERLSSSEEENFLSPNRGAAFAPEPVGNMETNDDDPVILTATGLVYPAQAINGITVGQSIRNLVMETGNSQAEDQSSAPDLSIALLERQRQELRSSHRNQPRGLFPGMLPRLRSLTLTNVPYKENSYRVLNSLIQFIKDCALETELAGLQASISKPSKRINPGTSFPNDVGSSAQDYFALSRIVLEMQPHFSTTNISNSTCTPQNVGFSYRTKSATEDVDSEALWAAQENDFTFFGDEEECGLPANEPDLRIPLPTISDKIPIPTDPANSTFPSSSPHPTKSAFSIDVVQELAKFRNERKAAYQEALKRGERYVEGYWPGEIKIVRWNPGRHGRCGEVDYYGNYLEGGIYR